MPKAEQIVSLCMDVELAACKEPPGMCASLWQGQGDAHQGLLSVTTLHCMTPPHTHTLTLTLPILVSAVKSHLHSNCPIHQSLCIPAEGGDLSVQRCLEWLMSCREQDTESTCHENMNETPCAEPLTLPLPCCTHPSSLQRYPQELLLSYFSPTLLRGQ